MSEQFPERRRIGMSDIDVTALSLGGTSIGSMYRPCSDGEACDALTAAWDEGIRFFDTAPFYGYGQSERRFGDFLRDKPRSEFVLSTKVGRMLRPGPRSGDNEIFPSPLPFYVEFDYSYDATLRSFEDSLQRLGLDRIDIVLIHDIGVDTHGPEVQPRMFREAMEGAVPALERLRDEGVIGAYGAGVNEWQVCLEAMKHGRFDCFLLAGRYTLIEQTAAQSFFPECVRRNVSIIAGGAFNSGLLADPYKKNITYNYTAAAKPLIEKARRIADVCARHDVPIQAAALNYVARHPAVATVAVGSRSASQVKQNVDWFGISVPEGCGAIWPGTD